MIIKTLVENTSKSEEFNCEHGLSLYIETKKHKLLFDLGVSDLFIENAQKLGVDLSLVDSVVISHGHYDHGGGLKEFLKINSKAIIYLHQEAFKEHYSIRSKGEKVYIGLDKELMDNKRIIFVNDNLKIDDELEIISNIKGKKLLPLSNQNLLMKVDSSYVQDDFKHEQNLIIREDELTVLLAGCCHKGIVNIIESISKIYKKPLDYVIGGFHLHKLLSNKPEELELLKKIGQYLKNTESMYYTCHCTGIEPYEILKGIMEDKIEYLSTGNILTI
ncbi:MBL fold metallo-hydrolase [Mycoplasmatota bacterium]|nr:MBL fold metallo-hydrolase [Mycoplasmatota bacterium]